jgi:hypothetical protein
MALSANAIMGLLGLIIGVLLFTGLVTYHAVFLIPLPSTFSPPSSNPEVIEYRNTVRALGWISIVAMDLAVSLSVMIAWIVGGMKGEQPEAMRRGVFLFATVFLAVWLIFSFFGYSIFRILIPFG